jgi:hypothetical protein
MRFDTMSTWLTGLREKEGGPTMDQPTRPEDLGQEAYYRDGLKDSW